MVQSFSSTLSLADPSPSSPGLGRLRVAWEVERTSIGPAPAPAPSGRVGPSAVDLVLEIDASVTPAYLAAIRWPITDEPLLPTQTIVPVGITAEDDLLHLDAPGWLQATLRLSDRGGAKLLYAATPLLTRLGVRGGGSQMPRAIND